MTEFAWQRLTPEYRSRPCRIHGVVTREMETGWTAGPDYVCPHCKDTDYAFEFIRELIKRCDFVSGIEILYSAGAHLTRERRLRGVTDQREPYGIAG